MLDTGGVVGGLSLPVGGVLVQDAESSVRDGAAGRKTEVR